MAHAKATALYTMAGCMLCAQADPTSAMSPSSTAVEVDACSLLTAAEISEVIGVPVDSGVRRDQGLQQNGSYSSACVWTMRLEGEAAPNPAAPLGGKSFVILNAMQWPVGSGLARTFLEAFHAAAATGEISSKPTPREFGDEALWWGDGLAVRKGDVSFGLSVFMPNSKPQRPGAFEEQLAPHILRRLNVREAV
jgi:hypothetical protein